MQEVDREICVSRAKMVLPLRTDAVFGWHIRWQERLNSHVSVADDDARPATFRRTQSDSVGLDCKKRSNLGNKMSFMLPVTISSSVSP